MRENWNWFTVYSPFLLAGRDGNLFVRDLHGRNTLMLARYPGFAGQVRQSEALNWSAEIVTPRALLTWRELPSYLRLTRTIPRSEWRPPLAS